MSLSPQDRIPRIAVVSGDNDQIECVLKRIGIDELDMYNGRALGTRNPPPSPERYAVHRRKTLNNYHIVVVNCTDNQFQSLIGARGVQQNPERYVGRGGRLYVTDWAYDVIEQVPEFAPYLCFEPQKTGGAPMMYMAGPELAMSADSYNFYGGQYKVLDPEMARWLAQFPSIIDRNDRVRVDYSFVVINKVSDNADGKTKVWVDGPAMSFGNRPQTVTLDYKSCGRLHYSTYNTEPNAVVSDTARWPNNCGNKLAPQSGCWNTCFQYCLLRRPTGLSWGKRSESAMAPSQRQSPPRKPERRASALSLTDVFIDDVTWGCAREPAALSGSRPSPSSCTTVAASSSFQGSRRRLAACLRHRRANRPCGSPFTTSAAMSAADRAVARRHRPGVSRVLLALDRDLQHGDRRLPPQVEALDIARKLMHNDAADLIIRHSTRIVPDHRTARHLFTLFLLVTHDTTKLQSLACRFEDCVKWLRRDGDKRRR